MTGGAFFYLISKYSKSDIKVSTMNRKRVLQRIWEKTNGHCHFCGDPVKLEKRGYAPKGSLLGYWETDHVIQRGKGGALSQDNCLPACTQCNRLRWHHKGNRLRELLALGLIAKDEIKKKSQIGKMLLDLKRKRSLQNTKRRVRLK